MRRRDFLSSSAAALAAIPFSAKSGFAEREYPQQPIRPVVPRAAGGVVDVVAMNTRLA
jgi:tripartite-type tricarboxylate transporter receptor subunit TctC